MQKRPRPKYPEPTYDLDVLYQDIMERVRAEEEAEKQRSRRAFNGPPRRRRPRRARFAGFGVVTYTGGPASRASQAISTLRSGRPSLHPNWSRSCDAALYAIQHASVAVESAYATGNQVLIQQATSLLDEVTRNAQKKCR